MPTKVISASAILKQKGVKQRNFDTNTFNAVVAKYFTDNEANATLMLYPMRFVGIEGALPENIFDIRSFAVWKKLQEKQGEQVDFVEMFDTEEWEGIFDDPQNVNLDFCQFITMRNNGLVRPTIFVNEPFIGNAAAYLRTICGFAVKAKPVKKVKTYIVSLPI